MTLLLASHGLALAQQVPPTVEPGTIQKRLERASNPKAAPPIDVPDTGHLTPPPGAAAITVRYRNDGYILSRAFVPPQEIIDGYTDIEVIEGYIDNIVVESDPSGPAAQIEDKIEAITASQPLRAQS